MAVRLSNHYILHYSPFLFLSDVTADSAHTTPPWLLMGVMSLLFTEEEAFFFPIWWLLASQVEIKMFGCKFPGDK